MMSWQLTTLPDCLNRSRIWTSVVLGDRLPTYSFVAIISFCCGRRSQWKFSMGSSFRLSPSKHARLIIYQSHCEWLLSASWVENRPCSLKSNHKNGLMSAISPASCRRLSWQRGQSMPINRLLIYGNAVLASFSIGMVLVRSPLYAGYPAGHPRTIGDQR